MENKWGIKISRIAFPDERLDFNEWVKRLNVSSQYCDKKLIHNAVSINNQYNFSKIKNKQYEPTNTGA
jgi:hypothetical protein